MSADGRERERCVRATPLTSLTARLLAIRATDWAPPVRHAVMMRLDACPVTLLVEALPLVDHLARERERGDSLRGLIDRRLPDEVLREAARAPDALVRRAAWRRLIGSGGAGGEDLAEAARDRDVTVRRVAAAALARLEPGERRRVARILVEDPVGAVAAPALGELVALDGAPAIEPALSGRSAGVRRAARDWAAVRGIDRPRRLPPAAPEPLGPSRHPARGAARAPHAERRAAGRDRLGAANRLT